MTDEESKPILASETTADDIGHHPAAVGVEAAVRSGFNSSTAAQLSNELHQKLGTTDPTALNENGERVDPIDTYKVTSQVAVSFDALTQKK